MVRTEAILGLDIGTTSTKAVLFDLTGAELAAAQYGYPIQTPQSGWVEQKPEDLWIAVIEAIRTVIDRAGPETHTLALALAAQSGSLIPSRRDGRPVYPAIIWMDGRTEDLVAQWRAGGIEAQVRQISGWSLSPGLCLPTISWLSRYRPDVFAAASHYFSVNDFITFGLTGRFCTNPSNGGGMQLVDIAAGQWSETLCDLAGISPAQLSPIHNSGEIIGKITPDIARLTGLAAETLVINGGHDQACTALGLGLTRPGTVLLACGTAWVVTTVIESPEVESVPPTINVSFHVAPGRWTAGQSLGGLGASLEWLVNQCWEGAGAPEVKARADIYTALNNELIQAVPASPGLFFLPMTGGHRSPASVRPGGFIGLRVDHRREDMARAVLVGAAFELRWALDHIRQAGMTVDGLCMVGGAAQSPVWPALIASVTGLPLDLPGYKHWAASGAAILAGVGVGVFETVEAGQRRFRKPAQQVTPDKDLMSFYDEQFTTYQQLVAHWWKII